MWTVERLDEILSQAIAMTLDDRSLEVECIDANKASSLRFALYNRLKRKKEMPKFSIKLSGAKVIIKQTGGEEEPIVAIRAVEVPI